MKILAHLLLWVYYYLWYKGFRELACIECVLDLKKKGVDSGILEDLQYYYQFWPLEMLGFYITCRPLRSVGFLLLNGLWNFLFLTA